MLLAARTAASRTDCSFVFSRCPPLDHVAGGGAVCGFPSGEPVEPGPDSPCRTGDLVLFNGCRAPCRARARQRRAARRRRRSWRLARRACSPISGHGAGGDGVERRVAERSRWRPAPGRTGRLRRCRARRAPLPARCRAVRRRRRRISISPSLAGGVRGGGRAAAPRSRSRGSRACRTCRARRRGRRRRGRSRRPPNATREQRAVEHEPGTDTLVDPDQQESAVGDAERELGERRGVGVVGDVDTRGRSAPASWRRAGPRSSRGGRRAAPCRRRRRCPAWRRRRRATAGRRRRPGRRRSLPSSASARRRCGRCARTCAAATTLPARLTSAADELIGLGEADRHDVAGVGLDADHRRRLADRPARAARVPRPAPTSSSSLITAETVAGVSPTSLARSAREAGPP